MYVKKDQQLPEVKIWGKEYEIKVDILIRSWIWSWGSIFRFAAVDGNCCNSGQRIVALWTQTRSSDRLFLSADIGPSGYRYFSLRKSFQKNQWYSFVFSQKKNQVFFRSEGSLDLALSLPPSLLPSFPPSESFLKQRISV